MFLQFNTYKIIIAALLLCQLGFSQQNWKTISKEEYLNKMKPARDKMANTNSYSMKLNYASYKGYEAKDVYDQQSGYILKNKKKFHSYSVGIHTIQDEYSRIAIDSVKKTITVNDLSVKMDASLYQKVDTSRMNLFVNAYKYAETDKTQYIRIEFKRGYPYEAMEIKLKDQWISQVVLFYTREVRKSVEDIKVKPKVLITYSDIKINPNVGEMTFATSKYINYEANKKVSLNNSYKDYKLFDQRVKAFLHK